MKTILIAIGILVWGFSASSSEIVKWTGVVQEEGGYHTPNHRFDHDLEFILQENGQTFNIENNPELLAIHSAKEKNLLVEIDATKSDRFLFWGGNLTIKSFKVIKELNDIAHHEPPRSKEPSGRFR